jgi:chromosome segregation ATPase
VNEEETTALQTELEGARKEAEELKGQLGERDARLGEVQRQLAEVTAAKETGEEELASLRAGLDDKEAQLSAATESLSNAVERYRASLIAANPEIPQDMIGGDAIGDIDASLEKAREMAGRVRTRLEEDLRATAVPAGAPQRSAPDLSDLSPREKIEYALRKEA